MDYLNGYTHTSFMFVVTYNSHLDKLAQLQFWHLNIIIQLHFLQYWSKFEIFFNVPKNTSLTYLWVVAWRDRVDVTTFIKSSEACMLENFSTTSFKTFFCKQKHILCVNWISILQLGKPTLFIISESLFSNFDYLFQMLICNWINLFNSLLHSRWLFGGHHKRKWNMYSRSNILLMILNYSMWIKWFGFHFICWCI